MHAFSVGECLSFGWNTFKKRSWFFIAVELLLVAVSVCLQILGYIPFLGAVVAIVGGILLEMGKVHFTLRAADRVESALVHDLWKPHPFWTFVGATILQAIISMGPGGILYFIWVARYIGMTPSGTAYVYSNFDTAFIVLGIIAALWWVVTYARLFFAKYLVLDKGKSATESLHESARITKGKLWDIILLGIALTGLNLLGLCALVVGLLVTMPVSMLAIVRAYRVLEHGASEMTPRFTR